MCRGPALGFFVVSGPTAKLVWHSHDFVTDWCLPIWTVTWPEDPTHTSHCWGSQDCSHTPRTVEPSSFPAHIPPPIKTYALSNGSSCAIAGMFVLK